MPHAIEDDTVDSAPIPRFANELTRNDSVIQHNAEGTQKELGFQNNTEIKPKDVEAQLVYLSPNFEHSKSNPPIQVVTRASVVRDPRTTVRLSQGPLERIHDVRGRESEFTLARIRFNIHVARMMCFIDVFLSWRDLCGQHTGQWS